MMFNSTIISCVWDTLLSESYLRFWFDPGSRLLTVQGQLKLVQFPPSPLIIGAWWNWLTRRFQKPNFAGSSPVAPIFIWVWSRLDKTPALEAGDSQVQILPPRLKLFYWDIVQYCSRTLTYLISGRTQVQILLSQFGGITQLDRVLPLQGRSYWFKSIYLHLLRCRVVVSPFGS